MVIGITGGIGSGKSLLCFLIREKGFPVVSADELAKKVVEPGTPGLRRVLESFGEDYAKPDGSLDRRKLAGLIFSDEAARKRLEGITHPLILELMKAEIAKIQSPRIFVEVPLLFEGGFTGLFDEVWLVVADERVRLDRIVLRDKIDYAEAKLRIASQLPDEEKAKAADVVLYNNGNIGDFEAELAKYL